MKKKLILIMFYLFQGFCNNKFLYSQTIDSIPYQQFKISTVDNLEIDLKYVLPYSKHIFLKELNKLQSQTHILVEKEVRSFYNNNGITINNSDYPFKMSLNQFLISPLSYYFEYDNIDSGYLNHTYNFLVSIPIIRTARMIREIGTINLILTIEDKELINLKSEKMGSWKIKSWRNLKSYKRITLIKNIKSLHIPEATEENGQ